MTEDIRILFRFVLDRVVNFFEFTERFELGVQIARHARFRRGFGPTLIVVQRNDRAKLFKLGNRLLALRGELRRLHYLFLRVQILGIIEHVADMLRKGLIRLFVPACNFRHLFVEIERRFNRHFGQRFDLLLIIPDFCGIQIVGNGRTVVTEREYVLSVILIVIHKRVGIKNGVVAEILVL